MKFDFSAQIPEIRIGNGKEYLNTEAAAEAGLVLTQPAEENADGIFLRLSLRNSSGKAVRLEKFNWRYAGKSADFLQSPGICACVEGWQMASPCGVRCFGDHDFRHDPGYQVP